MKTPKTIALLLAGIMLPFGATSAPRGTVQSYDTYKSWLVACDNTLECIAKGFTDGMQGAEITIERSAGPRGSLVAAISADHVFRLADVRIDGKPAGLTGPAWRVTTADGISSAVSEDIGAIRALVQRLRNATKVTFGGESVVPLDGFAAAMLRLDDRQGRLGGVTALAKPGPLPATSVPAAPTQPRIAYHPIAATLKPGEEQRLIAAVRASQKAVFAKEDCGDTPEKPEAHALDSGRALVFIPCLMGAYQGSSLGFITARNGPATHRLILPTPYQGDRPDPADVGYLTEGSFDPKTGGLGMAAKGRGLADCGISANWIWDGKAFQLSELALQQSCGGIGPGDWPTLFRSRH